MSLSLHLLFGRAFIHRYKTQWLSARHFSCKKRCSYGESHSPCNLHQEKGYPKFKKNRIRASVEYKTSGWKLSQDRRYLTFTDGFKAGKFKLWGSRNLHYYQLKQIKRVRVVRRYDGYYAQFVIDHKRIENKELTGKQIGIDVGLNHFYTDDSGNKIDNPRFLRKDERKIKRLPHGKTECRGTSSSKYA